MAKLDLSQFGPSALSADTLKLFQFLLQSPEFQNILGQNALAGQQFSTNLAQGLGQRGLSTSGIGTIANAAGQSATAFNEGALRGGLFGQAQGNALQMLLAKLQAYANFQTAKANQPSTFEKIAGGVLGAGAMALPFLSHGSPQGVGSLGGGLGGGGPLGYNQNTIGGGYFPGFNWYPNFLTK